MRWPQTDLAAVALALALCAMPWAALAQSDGTAGGAALQAKWRELQPQLRTSLFDQSIYLSADDSAERLSGDLYAEMELPFAELGAAFRSPAAVCKWLFLHVSIHACEPLRGEQGQALSLSAGPRSRFAPRQLYRISYAMQVQASEDAYLRVLLSAKEGPLATRDFRIVFEAVALDAGRSFVHFSYAYSYGTLAKIAMQAYLATVGRNKVGFTLLGRDADGQALYVRGERASLERSLMRNYLALRAYTSVRVGSPAERFEARLQGWFALSERYARQLHEIELGQYLAEKHKDAASMAGRH